MTPEIHPRPIAAEGSLARAVLDGDGPLSLPLATAPGMGPSEAGLLPRPGRLGPTAFGASGAAARRRLEAVLRGDGFFVSTGHQPILFLGPLYVLYKILTAIALARELESEVGRPVLPLFWIAADDHDWAEVGRATLLDGDDALRSLSLPIPEGGALASVGPHVLQSASCDLVDDLNDLLPQQRFNDTVIESVRGSYVDGRTLSEGFADLLRGVLGDRGYVWIDAGHAEVKRAAAPLYRRLVAGWGAALEAEAAGSAAVAEAGFEPPIAPVEGALPLFFDAGDGRRRVVPDDTGRAPADRWQERLAVAAERFSPNVASRPVLESYLLPVAATVLGPGEIAYWSQLPPLFELLGVPLPRVHPRAGWTLVEPRIRRLLDRIGIEPEDLAGGAEPVVARLTREARPAAVDAALDRFREAADMELGGVERAVADELPGLRAAVGKARSHVFRAADELSRQVDREARRHLDARIGQVGRAAANLYPERRPQERVLNPLPFLCRYGPDLVDDLARRTDEWVAASLAGAPGDG